MSPAQVVSNISAPTQFLEVNDEISYPDSGHGSLFQFHESFTRQATAFLASDSPFAPY